MSIRKTLSALVGYGVLRLNSLNVLALGDNVDGGGSGNGITKDDQAFGNWIKNNRGMSSDQLQKASDTLAPFTNVIGYVVGGAVVLVFSGIFLVTALDLVYLAIPPLRPFLYKGGNDGTGAPLGMNQQNAGARQWISDEAVACAALLGGSSQGMMNSPMPGGIPGMPGAGMGMQQPGSALAPKVVIGTYFKKRIVFMIILVICAIILTSSALLGTGVNLAMWGMRIIDWVNNYIPA